MPQGWKSRGFSNLLKKKKSDFSTWDLNLWLSLAGLRANESPLVTAALFNFRLCKLVFILF